MVPAMLAGNLHAKSGGESPAWVVALFFMLFWAVGLGLLYAGLRAKYAKHRIAVGAGEVKMTREMFGRAKTKALAWKDVTEVQKKEFYQQNYKPVYGIEIKGKDGKLRFGSMLTEEEKGWLVADMRRVVFGEPVLSRRAESSTREASEIRLSSSDGKFSVTMPRAAAAGITGLVFTLFGGGFVGIGIFVLPSGRFGAGHPLHKSSTDWFDMISGTFDSGFKVIWTLFSSIFLIAGIGLLVSWVRNLGVETKIEGDGFRIAIRKYKGGGVVSEKAFPRESLKAVRAYNSGTNNGKTMKAVELLFEGHAEKIARWMDGEKADALVEKIRRGAGMS